MAGSRILFAVDSVGIDPLGHDRPESVYSESRFLFPKGRRGDVLAIRHPRLPGILVETDVTGGSERGAIECAITYTSIFSGRSAVAEHGLMSGLGMNERLFERLVSADNLFRHFKNPCLANAVFPIHLPFFKDSYVQDLVPHVSREVVERELLFDGAPMSLKGAHKRGLPELFTLAEINQNIFVFAARQAGLRLRTIDDVRRNAALTSSLTHELEAKFGFSIFDIPPLPLRTPEEGAQIVVELAQDHDFVFYKYQLPDLISHTGRVELARDVFDVIERFVGTLLDVVEPDSTVIVTSDHGHLEQVGFTAGHPKSKVPTWCFGPHAEHRAELLRRPEGIFKALTSAV
jgi:hypothetical protein